MEERRPERKENYGEDEKTAEVWEVEKASQEMIEGKETGKTARVDPNLPTFEGEAIVNPPTAGGKILKNAVGARGHNPGGKTNPNYSMDTVRKAEEVINKGQERFHVKWPEK